MNKNSFFKKKILPDFCGSNGLPEESKTNYDLSLAEPKALDNAPTPQENPLALVLSSIVVYERILT